jgi:ubiquinone/menaquinone biosynthesis C-methylase UbiE
MDTEILMQVLNFIKRQDIGPVKRLLDMGCSDGETSIKIGKFVKCTEIFGVDIDDQAVQRAQLKNVKAVKSNLDIDGLPYADEMFDLVIMTEVIEHLINGDSALQEAYRVLSPTGYFLLTTPNLSWYVNRFVLLFGYQPYWTGCGKYNLGKFKRGINEPSAGHLRLFTGRALVQLLELNGFKIVALNGSSIGPISGLFSSVDKTIARLRWSLAQDIILLAKKTRP